MTKLSPAQQRAYDAILNAEPSTPDKESLWSVFLLLEDWIRTTELPGGQTFTHRWNGGRVYGQFNSATLKALAGRGLIRVHRYAGRYGCDEIELLGA